MNTTYLYKHPQDAHSVHQCHTPADVPVWAVDVRAVEGPINAWGLKVHPTDELVHWKDPSGTHGKLTQAWDKLEAAGLLGEAKLLMEAAASMARQDAAESAAGESL